RALGRAVHALSPAAGSSLRLGHALCAGRSGRAAPSHQQHGHAHAEPRDGPAGEPARDPTGADRRSARGRPGDARGPRPGAARERYLLRQPRAAYWVDFEDFSFWRLEVSDVYFVGGFAAMDWVTGPGYAAAVPDPLADAAEEIIAHMNRDHADALVTLARAH